MKISLITPAHKQSKSGNRTTAVRWARIFRDLGHSVRVATGYDGRPADLMVALHAWRSFSAIKRFDDLFPDRPIIVALTGTDINEFQLSHPEPTLWSMARGDELVCLHDLVGAAIPKRFGKKLHVIHQSSAPLTFARKPSQRTFDICVIGHLRAVKDPLRAAYAARLLAKSSRLRVIHLGKAHNRSWAAKARREMAKNPRFIWRGEVPGWAVRREFAKTHAMVISSRAEGGANVVSEAMVAGVPVIASDIAGNIGLLGKRYPGYFPAADTAALAQLLARAETDTAFLGKLARHCAGRAPLFLPQTERDNWRALLARVR